MRRTFTLLTTTCLFFLAFAMAASANMVSGRCQAEIKNEIAGLAIPKERIRNVQILNIYDSNGEGGGRVDRIEGWVSFTDCKGNLVVNMSNACLLQEIYTTYECRVPGVRSY